MRRLIETFRDLRERLVVAWHRCGLRPLALAILLTLVFHAGLASMEGRPFGGDHLVRIGCSVLGIAVHARVLQQLYWD